MKFLMLSNSGLFGRIFDAGIDTSGPNAGRRLVVIVARPDAFPVIGIGVPVSTLETRSDPG